MAVVLDAPRIPVIISVGKRAPRVNGLDRTHVGVDSTHLQTPLLHGKWRAGCKWA